MSVFAHRGSDPSQDPYAIRKEMYEERWLSKISSVLSFIPDAVAAVNVELNPVSKYTEYSTTYDPQAVPIESKTISRSEDEYSSEVDLPIVKSEVNTKVNHLLPRQRRKEVTEKEFNKSVASKTEVTKKMVGLVPVHVTASIAIPSSYFRNVWDHRHSAAMTDQESPSPTTKELNQIEVEVTKKVEQAVLAVLPSRGNDSKKMSQVTVTVFEDLNAPRVSVARAP